jgi:hypothetical protein
VGGDGVTFLVIVYVVNIALGAVLYLDLLRTRRSAWWLLAFKLATPPAVLVYLLTRRSATARLSARGSR